MKTKILSVVIAVLLVAGLGLILYPSARTYAFNQSSRQVMLEFEITSDELRSQEASNSDNSLNQLRKDMESYNQELYETRQKNLVDPFFFETRAFDLSHYGLENDVIGSLHIPKMNCELPLYLGADKENLAQGAGNLGQTSIPLGGTNSNAVIAAHRGYGTVPMFRDIESLEIGDRIYLTNFWETLVYKVTESKAILPTEMNEVYIQEGRDLVTLLTCHPYTKNYQRYLVIAERVMETSADLEAQVKLHRGIPWTISSQSQLLILLEYVIPRLVVVSLIVFVAVRFLKRRRKGYRHKKLH